MSKLTSNQISKNTSKTNLSNITTKQKKKSKKLWLKIIIGIVLAVVLTVLGYVLYVVLSYSRIEDNTKLDVNGTAELNMLKTDTEYTAVTYNIGFGAYTPDFTFFMDGGTQSWQIQKRVSLTVSTVTLKFYRNIRRILC